MTTARGWVIHRYDRVSSTMNAAACLVRYGASDRAAVIAAAQTAGRGRGSRVWQSPPGAALFCTLVLRPRVLPDRLSTLSLLAGVAVAEALETLTGYSPRLKWPNDVWMGEASRRKVAGILVTSSLRENAVDHVLIGIGINIAGDPAMLPSGATTIEAVARTRLSTDAVLANLLDRFDESYAVFQETGGRASLDPWRSRAVLIGEKVTIEDGGRRSSGVFIGVADDGALLLEEANAGIRKVYAGDLTRGPARALVRTAGELCRHPEDPVSRPPSPGSTGERDRGVRTCAAISLIP